MLPEKQLVNAKRGMDRRVLLVGGHGAACDFAHPRPGCAGLIGPSEQRGEVQRKREIGERQRVVGLVLQQFVEQADRLFGIPAAEPPDVPVRAHQPFPLAEFGGLLALRTLDFGGQDARRDGADDAVGDLVLDRENVLEGAVVALGP